MRKKSLKVPRQDLEIFILLSYALNILNEDQESGQKLCFYLILSYFV